MHIIMMAFVVFTVSQPQLPFEDDNEWVAEGYEVVNEQTYRISDYVDPYDKDENGVDQYFIDMCFNDEGYFSCAIAGSNEVCFLNEDSSYLSVSINHYRDIAMIPDECIAVASDFSNYNFLILGKDTVIKPISFNSFVLSWFLTASDGFIGIGEHTVVFCNHNGQVIESREYRDTGTSVFSQWQFAQESGIAVLMNSYDMLLEAYDLDGDQLWELTFPEASGGTKPMAVSENGETVAVSLGLNGVRIITDNGTRFRDIFESKYVLSIQVSPRGEYVGAVVAVTDGNSRLGPPEIYTYDVGRDEYTSININTQAIMPSICSVTGDGTILIGLNFVSGERSYSNVSSRRFALFDSLGDLVWVSESNQGDNALVHPIMRFMPYGLTNKGFIHSIREYDNNYQIGYLIPYSDTIRYIYIEKCM